MDLAEYEELYASAIILLTLLGAGLLSASIRHVRGTTLTGPWWWALAALLGLGASELLAQFAPLSPATARSLRLAAACSTLLPFMALLGAKRPQHQAWHFIVLTLWIVLVLPILEGLLLRPEASPDLRGIRSFFVMGLLLVQVVNHMCTRFWVPALLVGYGQATLLSAHLAELSWLQPPAPAALAGQAVIVAGLLAGLRCAGRRRTGTHPLDPLWLDFRDQFGLLWGLRVAERINAAANLAKWPIELRWGGFRAAGAGQALSAEAQRGLEQAMQNLLRRFVSPAWIARRDASTVH